MSHKKLNKRVISTVTFILVIVLLLLLSNLSFAVVYADEQENIIKTAEFTTLNDEKVDYGGFQKSIEENEKKYNLSDIKYEEQSTNKEEVKETKKVDDAIGNLTSKNYRVDENADYYTKKVKDGNKEYTAVLVSVKYDDNTMTSRTASVSGEQNLGYSTNQPSVPKTMQLSYYDSPTGKTYTVDAPLTSLETTGNSWIDAQYIDITVYNYTPTQYMINDRLIKHNENTVMSSDEYNLILDMAGYSRDLYKVKRVYWTSDPYNNGPVKNRNARADLQAFASYYTAYYGQSINLDDIPSYTAHLEYQYEAVKKTDIIHHYKAIATYKIDETTTTEATTEKQPEISTPVFFTISLFLALSILTVIIIILILAKKKKRKGGGEIITKGW